MLLPGALPVQADVLPPICPDRPGKGTSPCTVEAGHFQAELDIYDGSFQHRGGITTTATTGGGLLLKYGVNDRLDVEAGMALWQGTGRHGAGVDTLQQGNGDLTLRAKWNTGNSGPLAVFIQPFLKLPTATGGTGNGKVEGGFLIPLGYDLGGGWSLGATPESDVTLNASGHGYHAMLVNVFGINRALDNGLNLEAEIWTAQDFDPAATNAQASFDLCAALLADNDTQLDGGVNFGLNRATPDLQFYFGIARRF